MERAINRAEPPHAEGVRRASGFVLVVSAYRWRLGRIISHYKILSELREGGSYPIVALPRP